MPDIVGIRIVVHFRADVERVERLIEQQLHVDHAGRVVPRTALTPRRSGTHRRWYFVVRPNQDRYDLPEWVEHTGRQAEIQVRTLLDHTWAAIDHRLRYKREEQIPPEIRRINASIARNLRRWTDSLSSCVKAVLVTNRSMRVTRRPHSTTLRLARCLDGLG